jgi:hypothetical protein
MTTTTNGNANQSSSNSFFAEDNFDCLYWIKCLKSCVCWTHVQGVFLLMVEGERKDI